MTNIFAFRVKVEITIGVKKNLQFYTYLFKIIKHSVSF